MLLSREGAEAERLVVLPFMHLLQIATADADGAMDLLFLNRSPVQQQLMQQMKFGHRKAMAAGEGGGIARVINERD